MKRKFHVPFLEEGEGAISSSYSATPKEVTVNKAPDIPDVTIPVGTSPAAGRTEKAAEFEIVLVILIFLAAFISRRKIW